MGCPSAWQWIRNTVRLASPAIQNPLSFSHCSGASKMTSEISFKMIASLPSSLRAARPRQYCLHRRNRKCRIPLESPSTWNFRRDNQVRHNQTWRLKENHAWQGKMPDLLLSETLLGPTQARTLVVSHPEMAILGGKSGKPAVWKVKCHKKPVQSVVQCCGCFGPPLRAVHSPGWKVQTETSDPLRSQRFALLRSPQQQVATKTDLGAVGRWAVLLYCLWMDLCLCAW